MISTTKRTKYEIELTDEDRFVWEKSIGEFKGREFVVAYVEYETSDTTADKIYLRGDWLTPPPAPKDHQRNGWEFMYASDPEDRNLIRSLPLPLRLALIDLGLVLDPDREPARS